MKAVILAGGAQSTLNDSYEGIPKPMAEIGEKPILWHIMKYLDAYDISEFIICGGYKVNMLKDYFRDYYIYASDNVSDLYNNANRIENGTTVFNGAVTFPIDKQVKYIAILTLGVARIKELSAHGVRIGDISNDYKLDANDITGLVSILLDPATAEFTSCGDLNSDKITNIIDLVLLKKKIANN